MATALDWLSVPDTEQSVLRCLTKQPRISVSEIATITQIPAVELEPTLSRMVNDARLIEQLVDGQRAFSVRYSLQRTQVRNMPDSIFQVFEQPPDTFLAEVPLTASLTPGEREALLAVGTTRRVLPDEVFCWQGQQIDLVGVVRTGLLKKTHLRGRRAGRKIGYVNRAEWFGIAQAYNQAVNLETYTAVTDTELIVWSVSNFLNFARHSPQFSRAISQYLGHKLHECQSGQIHGHGELWAIQGVAPQSGATTLAVNLAMLAANNSSAADNGKQSRVLLWLPNDSSTTLPPMLGFGDRYKGRQLPGRPNLYKHPAGFDLLLKSEYADFAPQVQLNVALTELNSRYSHIICDTGASGQDELMLRLRGQAQKLMIVTKDPDGAAAAVAQWQPAQPFTRPDQKRTLALNGATSQATEVDARFHLVLPQDTEGTEMAQAIGGSVVEAAPNGRLGRALEEVYRRLSLNHAVAIFVPSTMDVNQTTDNAAQVQATLAFLGNLFGGATSSDAEGVWRSEDSGLVTEQVTIVRTFVAKKALDQHIDDVIGFAADLKKEMKQEAIAVDIDNQLVLV